MMDYHVVYFLQGVRKKTTPFNWIFGRNHTKNSITRGIFFPDTLCIHLILWFYISLFIYY